MLQANIINTGGWENAAVEYFFIIDFQMILKSIENVTQSLLTSFLCVTRYPNIHNVQNI